MTNFHKCSVWLDLGEGIPQWDAGEAEYIAHFDYSPGRPGKMYMRNGDPGYPDDPPELYINSFERNGTTLSVYDESGDGLLTDAQYETAERQVHDWICEQEAIACEAEYEHFRQARDEKGV